MSVEKQNPVFAEVKALVVASQAELIRRIPATAKDCTLSIILDQIDHQFRFSKNADKLKQCDPKSIAGAIKYCCQMGLQPGYGQGTPDVYLIPYGKDCQVQLSYQGELALAHRAGKFKSIFSAIIYEGDEFRAWNDLDGQHFTHEVKQFEERTTENIKAVYALALTHEGVPYMEMMSKRQVDELEEKTRKGSAMGPAWKNWWESMARKTLLRKVAKNLPMSADHALAETLDNQANSIDVIAEPSTNVKQFKTSQDVIG